MGATLVVVLPPGGDLEQGFGYVFLLVLIAVLGGVSAHALEEGQLMSRRQAEQELLSVGRSFEEALYSYSGVRPSEPNSGPLPGVLTATGPAQLEDLLKDPRVPGVRRHLRKIYPDPLTGKTEWGLVRNQAGHIVGIHSLSTGTPIKKSGFDARYAHFWRSRALSRLAIWVTGGRGSYSQAMTCSELGTEEALRRKSSRKNFDSEVGQSHQL